MDLIYCLVRLSSRRGRDGVKGEDYLASCEYHFIRVYENLVQHLSNNISIGYVHYFFLLSYPFLDF